MDRFIVLIPEPAPGVHLTSADRVEHLHCKPARRRWAGLLVACWLVSGIASGSTPNAGHEPPDWPSIGDQVVQFLRDYLKFDTVNPPGNEIVAARFFAERLERAGIEYEVFESAPGRGNVVARLRGDGSRGGHVVLLNHMDVVPSEERFWTTDPFGGELRDGRIYGRGAIDMKGYGAVQLITLLALHRAQIPLGRDVIFLGTAGEETGGYEGAGYVVESRPDLIDGVEYVLTEGGHAIRGDQGPLHLVEITQKTPLWLRLSARGPAGHGAMPLEDSAVDRLVRALERIRTYRPPIQIVPPVLDVLRAAAAIDPDPTRLAAFEDLEASLQDPLFLERLTIESGPLLSNSISITGLQGSSRTNVIPPLATAELDCRLLPGESADLFIATLEEVINDPGVSIEPILRFSSSQSPPDTALWRAIEEAVTRRDATARVLPTLISGFTDSHFFRERGIVAYGWSPFVASVVDGPAHGSDESIGVESLREAPRLLYEVLVLLAAASRLT